MIYKTLEREKRENDRLSNTNPTKPGMKSGAPEK
jgi:hypothetical protein